MHPDRSRHRIASLIVIALLGALAYCGYQTLKGSLETNRSLPEYSTYRADPKGLKALYESLISTDHLAVERRQQSSVVPSSGKNKVLIFAGVSPSAAQLTREEFDYLEHWIRSGGRLVIAFRSENVLPLTPNPNAGRTHPDLAFPITWQEWMERRGAVLMTSRKPPETVISPIFSSPVRWFGRNYFDRLSADWSTVATEQNRSVILQSLPERGSMVVLSDSYILSNEAMATERQTGFLLWLLGDRHVIVFDETHLGIAEHPGIMTLAGRYGLQGGLVTLFVVLLLFVWRCQYSLIPRKRAAPDELIVKGQNSEDTFLNLLQRSVPEKDLLRVCIETWLRSTKPGAASIEAVKDFESGAVGSETLVERYNRLAARLNRKV